MSRRPRCFRCGRGLSAKHRIAIEARLLLAIFGKPSQVCPPCADALAVDIPGGVR